MVGAQESSGDCRGQKQDSWPLQNQAAGYPKSVTSGPGTSSSRFLPRGAAWEGRTYPPGSGTHPRGFLSGTFQQTAVDGLHLGLQLRRHLLSSSLALPPLQQSEGRSLALAPAAATVTPTPGSQSRAVQAATDGAGQGAKEDANRRDGRRSLVLALGLSARESSHCLVRDPGKDTGNPRPGTAASHYRVPHQERGKNTREGKQSILGTVVVPGTGERWRPCKSAPREHYGSCSPRRTRGKGGKRGGAFPFS